MGGDPFGEVPVYAAGFPPVAWLFDPVVKLGGSDGGKCWLVLAVELFAVAPESLERRESNTQSVSRGWT